MELKGKVALITGAAGGLGRAVAAAFAQAGARRVLLDVNAQALDAHFVKEADHPLLVTADLSDPDSIARAVEAATQKLGRIDILCNVAGGFRMGQAVHETTDDVWNLMMGLNAGSIFNIVRAVVPGMLAAGSGKIVSVAAAAGMAGKPHMGAYCASKAVVIRLTESMAAELRDRGINVNCVMPTIIDTPANRADMPDADPAKWVAPEALADVIVFLASDRARAIHGAAIPVSGLS